MTRAQKRLYLSSAEGRNHDGSPRYPSRFVLDIDPKLLEYTQPLSEGLIEDARDYIRYSEKYMPESLESELLPIGARVRHQYLGEGTVLDISTEKGAYLVQFDGMTTPRNISFRVKLSEL